MTDPEESYNDDELELSLEFDEYDTRITLTIASPSGKKITLERFLMELEIYINAVDEANKERINLGATIQ